jgi:hypothetical protein
MGRDLINILPCYKSLGIQNPEINRLLGLFIDSFIESVRLKSIIEVETNPNSSTRNDVIFFRKSIRLYLPRNR